MVVFLLKNALQMITSATRNIKLISVVNFKFIREWGIPEERRFFRFSEPRKFIFANPNNI
ncbi:MAG TPA: hypothetical protein DD657_08715 [Culturomica sp.]|nr:hypothetical protein [Culturomica sp.]